MSSIALPEQLIERFSSIVKSVRNRPVVYAVGSLGIGYGLYSFVQGYLGFKALGRGGVPYNVWGYLLVLAVTPVARTQSSITDTSDLDEAVERIKKEEGEKAVFHRLNLDHRSGSRPKVGGIFPQRQLEGLAPAYMWNKLNTYMISLASEYPTILRIAPSALEGQVDALFLRRSPAERVTDNTLSSRILATMAPRLEITHVHDTDGSLHISLSPADAAEVVRKGWGTRHRLAGKLGVPASYTLIFGPRDDAELAIVKEIIATGVEYVSGIRGIADA